jgi:hypothetical protein
VKGVSKYPYACSAVKYNPDSTVQKNPWVACVALFSRRPWCAHVTVTPEANRIAVFFYLIYYTDSIYKVYKNKLQNCSCNQFHYIGTYKQVERNSMTKNRGGNDGSEK